MSVTTLANVKTLFQARRFPSRRVLVVNGNPDPRPERYCAALADAYAAGARASKCWVRRLDVGRAELTEHACDRGVSETALPDWESAHMLERLFWADRLFVVYPIWLGDPPPRLQAVFSAFARKATSLQAQFSAVRLDSPKPARVVATATFPTFLYRQIARSEPSARRPSMGSLAGVRVVDRTVIGSVESLSSDDRYDWLIEMRRLGKCDRDSFRRIPTDTLGHTA